MQKKKKIFGTDLPEIQKINSVGGQGVHLRRTYPDLVKMYAKLHLKSGNQPSFM